MIYHRRIKFTISRIQTFEEIDGVEDQPSHRDPTDLIPENFATVATAFVENPSFL